MPAVPWVTYESKNFYPFGTSSCRYDGEDMSPAKPVSMRRKTASCNGGSIYQERRGKGKILDRAQRFQI
jgi:hypothetical protein